MRIWNILYQHTTIPVTCQKHTSVHILELRTNRAHPITVLLGVYFTFAFTGARSAVLEYLGRLSYTSASCRDRCLYSSSRVIPEAGGAANVPRLSLLTSIGPDLALTLRRSIGALPALTVLLTAVFRYEGKPYAGAPPLADSGSSCHHIKLANFSISVNEGYKD